MLKIVLLSIVTLSFVYAHNNKQSNDADLQSELMPQELNPFFVPAETQAPSMPLPLRLRRNTEALTAPGTALETTENSTMQTVKTYTRIVAGIVLGLSALVEIIVYILENYT